MRVDHILSPQLMLERESFPHIEDIDVVADTYGSDHTPISFDVMHTHYSEAGRDRSEPTEVMAEEDIFEEACIATATAEGHRRQIARHRLKRCLGNFLPQLDTKPSFQDFVQIAHIMIIATQGDM